ncbi:hypothetical protein GCM10009680_68140 [Streptomyces yatensis]|uniref:Uncharacterized protein n=1 Tax=Streptomyces yatensis TaxID=155177 RepID=A0ABP4V3F9_9ACTN
MDVLRKPVRGDDSIEETFTYPRKCHLTAASSEAVSPVGYAQVENTIEGATECKTYACDLRHVPKCGRNCRLRLRAIARLPAALIRHVVDVRNGGSEPEIPVVTAGKPFRVDGEIHPKA